MSRNDRRNWQVFLGTIGLLGALSAAWKILHRTGLVWAAIVFVAPRSLEEFADPVFLTYLVAFLIALSIRITAWRQSRRRGTQRYAR